jgi:hypothetical protein
MATEGSRARGRETSPTGRTDIGADTREGIGTVRAPTSGGSQFGGSQPTGLPSSSGRGTGSRDDGWAGAIRQFASNRVNSRKQRASETLDDVARAIRASAQPLADHGRTTAAEYVQRTAIQLERVATRLDQQSLADMVADLQRFARSQPVLFVGAAFSLGLLGARFFKSSSTQPWERTGGMAR